ncbi:MAG: hypothetical protein ABI172_13040, partial [Ginsengibacter sp.]
EYFCFIRSANFSKLFSERATIIRFAPKSANWFENASPIPDEDHVKRLVFGFKSFIVFLT